VVSVVLSYQNHVVSSAGDHLLNVNKTRIRHGPILKYKTEKNYKIQKMKTINHLKLFGWLKNTRFCNLDNILGNVKNLEMQHGRKRRTSIMITISQKNTKHNKNLIWNLNLFGFLTNLFGFLAIFSVLVILGFSDFF